MKLHEFKVGHPVKDNFGNRYIVITVIYDNDKDMQPVKLLCTENSGTKNYFTFANDRYTSYEFTKNASWWIHRNELCNFSVA